MVGFLALCLALTLGICSDSFSIVSHAESQGKVIVDSARIRASASTSSERIGGVKKDKIINIISQVQGDDGNTWYEIWVDSNTKGFIRSDLVELVDGSTPTNPPPAATATPEPPAVVTAVNPVSAEVTGGTSVRIRSNASTKSTQLATVSSGLALTVTGQADGSDGMVWYQVSFISNGAQVNGFIRSDFVKLSGEITPVVQTPDPAQETPAPPAETQEPQAPAVTDKAYDTMLRDDGKWWVYDTATMEGWPILDTVDAGQTNADLYSGSQKTVKTQKIVIIILVFLLVGAGAGVAYLVFRLKDMMDSAYFNQVENETLRRRSAAAAQGGGQRVMHTVGTDKQQAKPAGSQGQRPAGSQGQRPAGAQSQKPAGAQGQKPAGAQGQKSAGAQGQKPAGAQGQRPSGAQGQRPAGAQGQKPQAPNQNNASRPQTKDNQQGQGWQSKNFMSDDDDEFEFEFLNVDSNGDDK